MSIKVKQRNAQPVSRLLANSSPRAMGKSELSPLLHKADAISRVQHLLEEKLPDEMQGHLLVGGCTQGTVTILTDKAVWLTWLRFERTQLLKLINSLPDFHHVDAIAFKVRPLRSIRPAVRKPPRYITEEASEHILACAEYTTDPKLKAALERLSAHTRTSMDGSNHDSE